MPPYVQVREVRRRARVTARWDDRGPSAYERWAYRAPWRAAASLALLAGVSSGRQLRRWAEPLEGPAGQPAWLIGSAVLLVAGVAVGWLRIRATAELYAEWSRERPSAVGAARWLVVAAVGAGAAALGAFASLPTPTTPVPEGETIGRAVAGSTGRFELLDGDVEAVGAHELSLVEEGLERWFVATRDADGVCFALVFLAGAHERTEPLAGPCTGSRARELLG